MRFLIVFIGWGILLLQGCNSNTTPTGPAAYGKLAGETMGTTYHITVKTKVGEELQSAIDQMLKEVNDDLNTYLDTSFITQFNRSEKGIPLKAKYVSSDSPRRHFLMNYYKTQLIYKHTEGYFDPTVMPLVQYWGFGTEKRSVTEIDKKKVAELQELVGMEKIQLDEQTRFLSKTNPGVSLDFSAIAKGYGVDALCEVFDRRGITDYFVEIGGEVRTKGQSPRQQPWIVGISTPKEEASLTDMQAKVKLSGMALASSGNYRNYYEVDGKKYGHTIDPTTGFPKKSDLLSASIFAEDCMTADAYATASMVMGLEKSMALIEDTKGLEGYFIYGNDEGTLAVKYTTGVADFLISEEALPTN